MKNKVKFFKSLKSFLDEAFGFIDICGAKPEKAKSLKSLTSNAFLDEAFGFIDICGAKPRIFSQRQSHKRC